MTAPRSTLPLMPNNSSNSFTSTSSSTHTSSHKNTTTGEAYIETSRRKSKTKSSIKKSFENSKQQNQIRNSKSPKSKKKTQVSSSPDKKKKKKKYVVESLSGSQQQRLDQGSSIPSSCIQKDEGESTTTTTTTTTAALRREQSCNSTKEATTTPTAANENTKAKSETSITNFPNPNTSHPTIRSDSIDNQITSQLPVTVNSNSNTRGTSEHQQPQQHISKSSKNHRKSTNRKFNSKKNMNKRRPDHQAPSAAIEEITCITSNDVSSANTTYMPPKEESTFTTSNRDTNTSKISSGDESKRDDSFQKQEQQNPSRNYHKSHKGHPSRKPYNAHSHKQQHRNKSNKNIHLVQERDVHNVKSNVQEDDTRTAVSPLIMKSSLSNNDTSEIIELNLNADEHVVRLDERISTEKVSSPGVQKNNGLGVNLKDRSNTEGNNSFRRKHRNAGIRKGDKKNSEKGKKASFHKQNKSMGRKDEQVPSTVVHEEKKIEKDDMSKSVQHDEIIGGDSRPTSPSSATSNVVTTNAAGEALLKRLGGSVTSTQDGSPSPDGVTESTALTTNEVDVDIDASTAFSGDVSGISMEQSQDHEQQTMMYPNPIVFPPMQQQRVNDAMIAPGMPYGTVPVQQQQQWIMPPQSEQEFMMAYLPYPATSMPPPYGPESHIMQAMAVPPPNFYGQGYPVMPQMQVPPIYQQQQQVSYTAPKPVKYEQVTIGGCVYFNPVYDIPGEEAEVDGSVGKSIEKTASTENSMDDQEQTSSEKKPVVDPSFGKQDSQRRKHKSNKRSRKKNQKKKSTEEKTITNKE